MGLARWETHKHIIQNCQQHTPFTICTKKVYIFACVGVCACVWVCVCQAKPCSSGSAVTKQLTVLSDRLTDFHKLIRLWGRWHKMLMKRFTSCQWKCIYTSRAEECHNDDDKKKLTWRFWHTLGSVWNQGRSSDNQRTLHHLHTFKLFFTNVVQEVRKKSSVSHIL